VARIFLSAAQLTLGRLDAADLTTAEMIAIADAEASPVLRWTAHANRVRHAALAGHLDEADALNNAVLERGQQLGEPDTEEWWASTAIGLLWLRGKAGTYSDAPEQFAQRYPLTPVWRTAQAWLYSESGRYDDARAVLDTYEFDPHELLYEPWPFLPTAQLALTAWHLGDRDLAARVRDALQPYRGCWVHYYVFVMGPVSWMLGLACATSGAVDEAVELLDEALDEVAKRGYLAHAALVGCDLAVVLRRRGGEADLARAARLLATARQRAEQVGAAGVVDRIDSLLS
jgi:tetratricopeptide (TPR) repeat protein